MIWVCLGISNVGQPCTTGEYILTAALFVVPLVIVLLLALKTARKPDGATHHGDFNDKGKKGGMSAMDCANAAFGAGDGRAGEYWLRIAEKEKQK